MVHDRIIIAGAGHAGGSAAAMLRQLGWKTGITLVGTEPLPPYQRPPLSKAWLTGEADADSLALQQDRNRLEERVVVVDDKDTRGHATSLARRLSAHIAASTTSAPPAIAVPAGR